MRRLVKAIIIILVLAFVIGIVTSLVLAADVCDDEVDANTACDIITPVISCTSYTYDLINLTDNAVLVDDGTITQIGTTGSYNVTFNRATGKYLVILCDNTTATINVRESQRTKLDNIITNQSTLKTGIDGLATNHSWINSSLSSIEITAEGIAVNDTWKNSTLATIKTILEGVSDNHTWINNTLADILADTNETQTNQNWDVWDDASRTLTDYNQSEMWTYLIQINSTTQDTNSTVYTYIIPINQTVVEVNVTVHGLANVSLNEIDTQLNQSHGTGLWNLSAIEVDTQLNTSHPGNWSNIFAGTVSINETAVAEEVWEYNVSAIAGGGIAGKILDDILTIVEWIERLCV